MEQSKAENALIKTPDGSEDCYGRWRGGEKGTKTVRNDNFEMDGAEDRKAYCVKEGCGGDILTDWRTLEFNIATIMGMGLSGCANMASISEALTVPRRRLRCLSGGSRTGSSSLGSA